MASGAYEQILAVQALDIELRQLTHRCQHHPVRAAIAELDGEIAALAKDAEAVDEVIHDLERQQKRKQDEVSLIDDRRKEIEAKLYGGEVTASKDLLALQEESATLLERQHEIEDAELELMEQLEQVTADRAVLADSDADLAARRQASVDELDRAVAEIQTESADVEQRRSAAAAEANPQLLEHYEELRDQFDGIAVARLVNGACDGCNIHLSAVAVDRLQKMPDDAVVTCEECGRLLVR